MIKAFVLITSALLASAAVCQDVSQTVVARVDGEAITAREVDSAAATKLLRIKSDEYRVRKDAIEQMVADRLVAREAARQGISVDAMLKAQVDDKIEQPTDEQLSLIYSATKDKFANLPEGVAKAQIAANLRIQRTSKRKAEFISVLKRSADIAILLDPPRMKVDPGTGPSLGPADAAVTVVEFSDFECPFCSKASSSLKELVARYPNDVRVVFREFPLPFHHDAAPAARAAFCAGEQGKFWQLHDALFQNQRKLETNDLRHYAEAAGLDLNEYDRCTVAEETAAAIQKDVLAGVAYGVSSTPTIFVNGRLVGGAVPVTALSEVVDEELSRLKGRNSPKGSVAVPTLGNNMK